MRYNKQIYKLHVIYANTAIKYIILIYIIFFLQILLELQNLRKFPISDNDKLGSPVSQLVPVYPG